MSRFRIGPPALLACTLPAIAAFAGPSEPNLRAVGDMATRLNAATVEQGRAVIQATLAPTDPSARAMTFSGPVSIYYDGPKRPDYATVGTVGDALGDRSRGSEARVTASVRYGSADRSPVAGFFERVEDPDAPRVTSGMTERLAQITGLPPGEAAPEVRPSIRPGVAGPVRAGVPAGSPTVGPPTIVVNPPVGMGPAGGAGNGAAPPLPAAVPPAGTPSATVPAAPMPPLIRPRSVFVDAASAGAGESTRARVSSAMAAASVQRLLAESAYFPGGALPETRPLSDVFPLSAKAAMAMPAQGTSGPPDGVVVLPISVFPAIDAALPVNVRLFRDRLPRLDLEGWLELMLERIQSLSGPEIVSLGVAAIALFGLAQLWRGRRRME